MPVKRQTSAPESSTLPASPEVERSVLGILLTRDTALYEMVAAGLSTDYFCLDSNRRIFLAIQRLAAKRQEPNLLAVIEELDSHKELQSIGDVGYLSSLLVGLIEPSNLSQYVEILREKHLRRRLIQMGSTVLQTAIDLSDPIEWTITGLQDDLYRLQGGGVREGYSIEDFDSSVLAKLKEQNAAEGEIIGLPFGVNALDDFTTGIREGEFIPLGGYPSSGKTAFACNVARHVALKGGGVGIFSIEMKKEHILHRLWAQASDIPYASLRNPKLLDQVAFAELEQHWMPMVRKLPIKIDDNATHIDEIIPRAHLWVRRHNVKLIILDFLQRVHAPGKGEYEIVSYSADALTEFAKVTDVPVLCLSQLSRPEDKKNPANVVPTMSMLRSSGRIEQNAHLVLFTFRPEDENGDPTGEDLIVVGKQRGGKRGRIKSRFDGASQTWGDRA